MTREYSAFLLRLWRNQPNQPWRVTLQNAQTGEQKHFANLERAVAFLAQHHPDKQDVPKNIVEWVLSN